MTAHVQKGTGPCSGCGGPHKVTDRRIVDEVALILIRAADRIEEDAQRNGGGK